LHLHFQYFIHMCVLHIVYQMSKAGQTHQVSKHACPVLKAASKQLSCYHRFLLSCSPPCFYPCYPLFVLLCSNQRQPVLSNLNGLITLNSDLPVSNQRQPVLSNLNGLITLYSDLPVSNQRQPVLTNLQRFDLSAH
jgi:hypothetical protein